MFVVKNTIDLFDGYFYKAEDPITQTMIQTIVEDRKYDIPDWFYRYITDTILVSLIYNFAENIWVNGDTNINDKFKEFLSNCESKRVINSYKSVSLALYETGLLRWAYFMKPDKVYKSLRCVIKSEYRSNSNLTEQVVDLICMFAAHEQQTSVPLPFINLYILSKCGYINKVKDKVFKSDMNITNCLNLLIDTVIYDELTCERVFSTIWMYYGKLMSNNRIKLNDELVYTDLVYYWKRGINYIPDNASFEDLYNYGCHPSLISIPHRPLIYHNYATLIKSKGFTDYNPFVTASGIGAVMKHGLINHTNRGASYVVNYIVPMRKFVMSQIQKDINNVHAIFWKLDIHEKKTVIELFKSSPGDLADYSIFYRHTDYIPTKDEFKEFLRCGGDIHSIKDINVSMPPIEYVDTLLSKLTIPDIQQLLLSDTKVPNLAANLTYYEFIMREYVLPNPIKYPFIFLHIKDAILSSPELIEKVREDDMRRNTNKMIKLLNLERYSAIELGSKYPDLIKLLPYLYTTHYDIKMVLNVNHNVIYRIPWSMLSKDIIISEIEAGGYLPINIGEDENLMKFMAMVKYVGTQNIKRLIENGKGFGYIIDYDNAAYLSVLIHTAASYINRSRNS